MINFPDLHYIYMFILEDVHVHIHIMMDAVNTYMILSKQWSTGYQYRNRRVPRSLFHISEASMLWLVFVLGN